MISHSGSAGFAKGLQEETRAAPLRHVHPAAKHAADQLSLDTVGTGVADWHGPHLHWPQDCGARVASPAPF